MFAIEHLLEGRGPWPMHQSNGNKEIIRTPFCQTIDRIAIQKLLNNEDGIQIQELKSIRKASHENLYRQIV